MVDHNQAISHAVKNTFDNEWINHLELPDCNEPTGAETTLAKTQFQAYVDSFLWLDTHMINLSVEKLVRIFQKFRVEFETVGVLPECRLHAAAVKIKYLAVRTCKNYWRKSRNQILLVSIFYVFS